jgi:hypothetical protein
MSEQVSDPMAEVKAMGTVAEALKGLDSDAIGRVLQWAAGSYGAPLSTGKAPKMPFAGKRQEEDAADSGADEFASLADLFAAAQPKVDSDRALVAGYWYQFKEGQNDFASQTINTALKNLGHGVSNITKALETLKAQSPGLVMQVRKSGSSQQARKHYKLTTAGKKAVELLVGQGQAE